MRVSTGANIGSIAGKAPVVKTKPKAGFLDQAHAAVPTKQKKIVSKVTGRPYDEPTTDEGWLKLEQDDRAYEAQQKATAQVNGPGAVSQAVNAQRAALKGQSAGLAQSLAGQSAPMPKTTGGQIVGAPSTMLDLTGRPSTPNMLPGRQITEWGNQIADSMTTAGVNMGMTPTEKLIGGHGMGILAGLAQTPFTIAGGLTQLLDPRSSNEERLKGGAEGIGNLIIGPLLGKAGPYIKGLAGKGKALEDALKLDTPPTVGPRTLAPDQIPGVGPVRKAAEVPVVLKDLRKKPPLEVVDGGPPVPNTAEPGVTFRKNTGQGQVYAPTREAMKKQGREVTTDLNVTEHMEESIKQLAEKAANGARRGLPRKSWGKGGRSSGALLDVTEEAIDVARRLYRAGAKTKDKFLSELTKAGVRDTTGWDKAWDQMVSKTPGVAVKAVANRPQSEATRLKAIEKQIKDMETGVKRAKGAPISTPQIEALKRQRDQLRKALNPSPKGVQAIDKVESALTGASTGTDIPMRALDTVAGLGRVAASTAESFIRAPISRIQARSNPMLAQEAWTLDKWKRALGGTKEFLKEETAKVLSGLDETQLDKMGGVKTNSKLAKVLNMGGLSDVPARHVYYHMALDDFAGNIAKQTKGDRVKILADLRKGKIPNGVKPEQFEQIMEAATEASLEGTFNNKNLVSEGIASMERGIEARGKAMGLEVPAKIAQVGLKSFMRFSKVLTNVGLDAVNRGPGGLVEGAVRVATAKNAKVPLVAGRRGADILSKGIAGSGIAAVASQADPAWLGMKIVSSGSSNYIEMPPAIEQLVAPLGGVVTILKYKLVKDAEKANAITPDQAKALLMEDVLAMPANVAASNLKNLAGVTEGDNVGKRFGTVVARGVPGIIRRGSVIYDSVASGKGVNEEALFGSGRRVEAKGLVQNVQKATPLKVNLPSKEPKVKYAPKSGPPR